MSLGFTVVQHAGYGHNGDPQFAQGLQVEAIDTGEERRFVELVSGVVFPDYGEAATWMEKEQYPDTYQGLRPVAPGQFSELTVKGLRIYVPKHMLPGRWSRTES